MRRPLAVSNIPFALALGAVLCASPDLASAGQEQARTYYRRAQKLYQQGKFERAAELLAKAYDEEPNLTYQYNRIRALEGAEEYEKALEVLETYEQPFLEAEGYENIPTLKRELRAKVNERTERVESPSSSLDPPNASSSSSDSSADTGGDRPERTEKRPSRSGRDAGSPSPRAGSARPWGWALIGTGGTFLVGGGILSTGVHLWGAEGPPNAGVDSSTLRRHRALAGAALGLGVTVGAVGLVVLLRHSSSADRKSAEEVKRRRVELGLVPYVGRTGGGARLEIDF